MAKPKQSWSIGDVFAVQTSDDKYVIGQIVSREPDVLNSVSIAFFDLRFDSMDQANIESIEKKKVFSVVFATRELLDSGVWKVIANRPINIPREWLPYEHLRRSGFVGAKVIGAGILNEFLNAFYALAPWDDWKDPQYLDRFLLSPEKKPDRLIYKQGSR